MLQLPEGSDFLYFPLLLHQRLVSSNAAFKYIFRQLNNSSSLPGASI